MFFGSRGTKHPNFPLPVSTNLTGVIQATEQIEYNPLRRTKSDGSDLCAALCCSQLCAHCPQMSGYGEALLYVGTENPEIAAASQTASDSSVSQSLDPEERNKLQSQIYSGLARNWNEEFQVGQFLLTAHLTFRPSALRYCCCAPLVLLAFIVVNRSS